MVIKEDKYMYTISKEIIFAIITINISYIVIMLLISVVSIR
jgi:hypothetical protein